MLRRAAPTARAAATAALAAGLCVPLGACGSAGEPQGGRGGSAAPATSPPATSTPATSPPAPTPPGTGASSGGSEGAPDGERVRAVLDGVELSLEVADEPSERAVGLMRRTEVPPGTGMVFLYDELSDGRYYMFDVPVPLRAVFVRDGRVVSSVLMPPCEEPVPQDCETYGADGPYDTVVETAPETLPDVQPGDVLELER